MPCCNLKVPDKTWNCPPKSEMLLGSTIPGALSWTLETSSWSKIVSILCYIEHHSWSHANKTHAPYIRLTRMCTLRAKFMSTRQLIPESHTINHHLTFKIFSATSASNGNEWKIALFHKKKIVRSTSALNQAIKK